MPLTKTVFFKVPRIRIIPLTGTCACGRCGAEIAAEVLPERRQVVEVVTQRAVTEYRIVGGYSAVPSPKGSRPPSSTVRECWRSQCT